MKKKRDRSKTRLDDWAFKNLKQNIMTQERKDQLGDFLIQYGYRLKKDTSGKTTTEVMNDFKSILINLKKLKENE